MKYSKMEELKDIVVLLQKCKEFKSKLEHINPDRILYASFSRKNSKVYGKIGSIPSRFAIFIDNYDYFLEINIEKWLQAEEGMRLYIILHELLHIPVEGFDKESKYYKRTIPHDLEDFKDLIKDYGVDCENSSKLVNIVNK